MLIIVGREHEGLYKGLKARQEANGEDRVILDRRSGERRQGGRFRPKTERRTSGRRLPLADAECALMNVLGFTVLHRKLSVLSGDPIPRKPPASRAAGRASTRIPERSRKRAAS
jgi:hypothetical protein